MVFPGFFSSYFWFFTEPIYPRFFFFFEVYGFFGGLVFFSEDFGFWLFFSGSLVFWFWFFLGVLSLFRFSVFSISGFPFFCASMLTPKVKHTCDYVLPQKSETYMCFCASRKVKHSCAYPWSTVALPREREAQSCFAWKTVVLPVKRSTASAWSAVVLPRKREAQWCFT